MDKLMQLIAEGNIESLRILLQEGLDPNYSFQYSTMLDYALNSNQKEIAILLVENGANVNDNANPAFVDAAAHGNRSLFEFLLRNGADINAINHVGHSALSRAISFSNIDGAIALIELGMNIDIHGGKALRGAAWDGDFEMVRRLVERGADVNYNEPDQVHSVGGTPLSIAARDNHIDVANYLIEHGADLKVTNMLGERAYHYARQYGHEQLAERLKLLEPNEFHDYDYKMTELAAAGVPIQVLETLGTSNRRMEFNGNLCEFLVFRTIFEITHYSYFTNEVYDLLFDLDSYDATGVLTWCPSKQCFISVDIEHQSIMVLYDMTWDQFLVNPGYYLDRILDGFYEAEELDFDEVN